MRPAAAAVLLLIALLACVRVEATPFWIEWNGDDGAWPEAVGYKRNWGNWQGQYQGFGALRFLHNGVLTYDSLYDPGVADFYWTKRPGEFDPNGPHERLLLEWRLKIDQVNGPGDPGIALFSDDAWALGYTYAESYLRSIFEDYLSIPFAPGVWHEYRLISADMRSYDLWIDGDLVHHGTLKQAITKSYVAWGDGTQGAASLHHWDYVRFGVVIPEPSGLAVALWLLAWRVTRRG